MFLVSRYSVDDSCVALMFYVAGYSVDDSCV